MISGLLNLLRFILWPMVNPRQISIEYSEKMCIFLLLGSDICYIELHMVLWKSGRCLPTGNSKKSQVLVVYDLLFHKYSLSSQLLKFKN
jgi:hypothetical protein